MALGPIPWGDVITLALFLVWLRIAYRKRP